ncbi:hypothetical protein ABCS02_12360 [Microbacterium sp. X-17]|uniref:hypothetical protein n=1 Tax=Microbacterium sp. X-17 TaxID=3144404 RepID=UPI0031F48A62
MEPVFQFLGSYWWLVFPLGAGMAAIGRAWEGGARRRHRRRLEILRAKSEYRVARAEARGRPNPGGLTAPGTAPAATERPLTQPQELERLFATHDAVTKRWLDYELDVAKLIAYPAMSDGRQPLTAAFLRAKKLADGLRPASPKVPLTRDQFVEYRNAVTDFEVAFDVAERDAKRVRDSSFTETERKRLDTAKQLLTVAIDQAATPAERQLAYRRVREELDGLISLSDGAIEVLENRVSLELTPGTPASPGTPGTDTAAPATPVPATPAPATPATPGEAAPPAPPTASAPQTGAWPVPSRSTGPGRVVHPKR